MTDSCYWDACLFIDVLQKVNQARVDACQELIVKAKNKSLIIVTSTWTITEVNKLDALGKAGMLPEDQSKMILDFFENPYISLRQLDRETAELAHNLCRTHSLTNADAIHVATALVAKVPVLYTYDAAKGKRKGLLTHNLKIGDPPLRIEMPPDPAAKTLFDKKNRQDAANSGK